MGGICIKIGGVTQTNINIIRAVMTALASETGGEYCETEEDCC